MLDLPATAEPGDPLTQPTRARLFALLCEQRRPMGTAELAALLGLHPNGVRAHLERLERAGLVTRGRSRPTRGRPPDSWAVAPGARPAGRAPDAYRDLARWLARALRARAMSRSGIERLGREIGRELAQSGDERGQAARAGDRQQPAGTGDRQQPASGGRDDRPAPAPGEVTERALEATLAALGFQPDVRRRTPDQIEIRLGNCPYREAARENPEAVCGLHRGITLGLLDTLAPGARLSDFRPTDPARAGCRIAIRAGSAPAPLRPSPAGSRRR
ncbi:MAG TPA: helix-turn-helix domain-containing protein [Solirubrobacteraceae bacterium]|nr:helix-turn-helix domain-containing protein [Solirubrobacteraceae bacterium]